MSYARTPTNQNLTTSIVAADPYLNATLLASTLYRFSLAIRWTAASLPSPIGIALGVQVTDGASNLAWNAPGDSVAHVSGDTISFSVTGIAGPQLTTLTGYVTAPSGGTTLSLIRGQSSTNADAIVLQTDSLLILEPLAFVQPIGSSYQVRLYGFSGVAQLHQEQFKQYNSDSVQVLMQPYEWEQTLTTNGAVPIASTPAVGNTKMLRIEVPDGQTIRYEINPPNRNVGASVNSPSLSGKDQFFFGPGWSISVIDAAAVAP